MHRLPLRLRSALIVVLVGVLTPLACSRDKSAVLTPTSPALQPGSNSAAPPNAALSATRPPVEMVTKSVVWSSTCDHFAKEICAYRHPCCDKTRVAFNQDGCEGSVRENCQKNLDEVALGKLNYHPEKIDACLSAVEARLVACDSKLGDLEAILIEEAPCRQIFQGAQPVGGTCTRSAQCKQSPLPNHTTMCQRRTGKCVEERVLGMHEQCPLTAAEGRDYCGPGLYCESYILWPDFGFCEPTTPLGGDCMVYGVTGHPCALGTRCDMNTNKCVLALENNWQCSDSSDCLSRNCVSHVCAPSRVLLDPTQCGFPCSGVFCP